MENLLKFIGKHSNFLIFLILEVVAFLLIGRYNTYPQSKFLSSSNAFLAWQDEQISFVKDYFSLRSVNEQLVAENARLRASLGRGDSVNGQLSDSLQQITYIPAKVIRFITGGDRNYLTINKGTADGVAEGMGVRNQEGAVGIVCTTNEHYSVVLPIIHVEANLSCRFLKNDYLATLYWSGRNPDYAFLQDVAAHIPVCVSDTIVTSGLTSAFPEGVPVGQVEETSLLPGDSYYTVRVKLYTDFRKIKYVEVIDNKQNKEIPDEME